MFLHLSVYPQGVEVSRPSPGGRFGGLAEGCLGPDPGGRGEVGGLAGWCLGPDPGGGWGSGKGGVQAQAQGEVGGSCWGGV